MQKGQGGTQSDTEESNAKPLVEKDYFNNYTYEKYPPVDTIEITDRNKIIENKRNKNKRKKKKRAPEFTLD